MAEVSKLVDGQLTTRQQTEVTVGDGEIIKYLLSEHQFETLGKNGKFDSYLSVCTFCLGVVISIVVDLFSANWNVISVGLLIKCCVFALCLGVGAFAIIIYCNIKRNYRTTYDRLKEEAQIITERQRQP